MFSERNPPKKSRFWDELNYVQFEKLAFSKRYCYLKTDFSKSLERSRTQFLKGEGQMEHPRQNYGLFFNSSLNADIGNFDGFNY